MPPTSSASFFTPSNLKTNVINFIRGSITNSKRAWNFYRYHNENNPRLTATITGATLWGAGDIYVQKRIDKVEHFETHKLWGSMTYGGIITGFLAFYWYSGIEWIVKDKWKFVPKTPQFVLAKIFLELGFNAPLSLFCFWNIMGKYEGKRYKEILDSMHEDNKYRDSLVVDWILWFPIDIVNFGFVPVKYQILAVNGGCLLEAVILGKMEADASKREQEKKNGNIKQKVSGVKSSSSEENNDNDDQQPQRRKLIREHLHERLDGKSVRILRRPYGFRCIDQDGNDVPCCDEDLFDHEGELSSSIEE